MKKIIKNLWRSKNYSTSSRANVARNIVETEYDKARSYSSIPGPSIPQLIKAFLPGGKFYNLPLIDFYKKIRSEYGDIVKFPGILGQPEILMSYDPNDFEKIFRTDGSMPIRRGLQTLGYYRKEIRPDVFKGVAGLATDNGEKWQKFRTVVNPILMKPKSSKLYIPQINEISHEFVDFVKKSLDSNNFVPNDFYIMLNRWSLESIGYISFNRRLGVLDDKTQDEKSKKMIELLRKFNKLSNDHESEISAWRYFHTPSFKRLLKVYDGITNIIMEYLEESMKDFQQNLSKDESEAGILEKLLKIDKTIAISMMMDMLIAGVHTVSSAISGILYCLAKNSEKQELLREEIMNALPDKKSKLTIDNMRELPYLRAVIKESLRMFPPTTGTMRATQMDLVFQGYQVPKNTDIMLCAMNLYYDENYFKDCDKFIPERWLKSKKFGEVECPHAKPTHKFAYIPFGFGVRMCIGRRFAEMELEILTMRLLREFEIEWHQPDLKIKSELFNVPDANLKFKLIPL